MSTTTQSTPVLPCFISTTELSVFKCACLKFDGCLIWFWTSSTKMILNLKYNFPLGPLKDSRGSGLIQPEPAALYHKWSLMNSDVPSLLSDGWFGPFERTGRRLPEGKEHLLGFYVPPAVGCVTCGGFFHPQCFSEVHKAFAALEAAMRFGNLSRVAADFKCCQVPKDLSDQVTHKCSEGCFFLFQIMSIIWQLHLSIQEVLH